jgi:oligosaccharide 4-alpha-D-glucosyltransferase
MRKIILLLAGGCSFFFTLAQQEAASRKISPDSGYLTVTRYSENIYKITCKESGSVNNEQLSDAVLLKPSVNGPMEARVAHDTVYIRDRPFVVGNFSNAEERGFFFPLEDDEMIFGGGERALPLNRRGYRLNLYNNPWYGYSEGADNLNYSVPFITSSKGYGLFFDNPSKGYIDIGKSHPNMIRYGASSGELNVFVILGDYRQVLHEYYRLTGTQPLPPRWALGNLMSRFGYTSDTQVTNIAAKMQIENIPIDAVIFDLFWFGDSIKGSMGNLEWVNKKAWPNPQAMISKFRQQGIHSILVTEPFFLASARNYNSAQPFLATDSAGHPYRLTDFYFGAGGLLDIFRNDAQQWFWQFYKKQMDNGVDGWWGDLGEPEKHPADLYHNLRDLGYQRLFRSDEVHNIYGHSWTKMLYNQYAKAFPDKRLFSLNRAGFAGSQRYSIFPWTGDVSRSWSGLRSQLDVLLGMSMSGVPYVHSDAGGFAGGTGDNELYVRWLQFAAYTPIFRPHGTALYEKDTGAFSFPSEAALINDEYRGYARTAIRTRYEMLPYTYSLAYQQAVNGKPLIAPLYYYYPNDTAAAKVDDEYFWGENILVAPVLQKAATERRYYLPAGDWFNPRNLRWLKGGWHTDGVQIWDVPVFYRAGSFTPAVDLPTMDHKKQMTNVAGYHADKFIITYVESPEPSYFQLYDDDGENRQSIAKKQYELIQFKSSGLKNRHLTLRINSEGGTYAGKPAVRQLRILVASKTSSRALSVLVNGQQMKEAETGNKVTPGYYMAPPTGLMMFAVDYTGKPLQIEIYWK